MGINVADVGTDPAGTFILQTGFCDAVIAGDTQGNIHSSYPLAEDGNYKFWVSVLSICKQHAGPRQHGSGDSAIQQNLVGKSFPDNIHLNRLSGRRDGYSVRYCPMRNRSFTYRLLPGTTKLNRPLRLQIYADPYKGMVTKEDGSEVEEEIYEAYNMSLVS